MKPASCNLSVHHVSRKLDQSDFRKGREGCRRPVLTTPSRLTPDTTFHQEYDRLTQNDTLRTESPGFHRNRKVVSCKKLNEMDIISGLEIKGFLFIKKDPR